MVPLSILESIPVFVYEMSMIGKDLGGYLSAKLFAQRLNHCLDDMGAPAQIRERAVILSKMLDIPKQQAWSFLEGQVKPDADLLQIIAGEFEVDPKWLAGDK